MQSLSAVNHESSRSVSWGNSDTVDHPKTNAGTSSGSGSNEDELTKSISVFREQFKRFEVTKQQDVLGTLRNEACFSSTKTKSSSMEICYRKAVETKLFQAKEQQILVWAERSAHEDLSVRFDKFNKILSLPAAVLASITACFGVFTATEARDLSSGITDINDCITANTTITASDCDGYDEVKATGQDLKPIIGWAIVGLSAFTTVLVTINTVS